MKRHLPDTPERVAFRKLDAARKRERTAQGLCVQCGLRQPTEGHNRCPRCFFIDKPWMRGLGHDAQEALWQAHQGVGNLIQVAIKLERKLTVRWTLPRSRKLRETFKALVFARDGRFTCNNCGRVLTDDGLVQVDHIIPLGAPYFGTDTLDNMQILNPDCHAQKTYREATSAKMHV